MNFSRRDTLVMAAATSALALSGVGAAQAQENVTIDVAKLMAPTGMKDHVLGATDAKVTVIEYASPTCPHCAAFSNTVYPTFKEKYIDNNKIQFILRPFVRNVLDAVVFMLAEASGETGYHNVIETYFKTQDTWAVAENPRNALLEIAKQLGFTDETFEAALTNQDMFKGMETLRDQAVNDFKLSGTPTFYINGKLLSGEKSLEELSAEIDPLLA